MREAGEQEAHYQGREGASYDIIRNMTEKYGGGEGGRGAPQGFETRRSNLENVLSKMNRGAETEGMGGPGFNGEHHGDVRDQAQGSLPMEETNHIENQQHLKPPSPQPHAPIKLRIAGGEVVGNTVMDGEVEAARLRTEAALASRPEVEMEKPKRRESSVAEENVTKYALNRLMLSDLQHSLTTDEDLKARVSDIVGEDVLRIFADAVSEAESSGEEMINNKNVVFLYYAVKNSTQLDLETLKKAELEPLSNLALSTALLSKLLEFISSDPALEEQLEEELGTDHLSWLREVVVTSQGRDEEFLQDPCLAPQVVPLYHTARNTVLKQALERMTSLLRKTEAILGRTTNSEDPSYNSALAKLQSLVAAPWSQQVIAVEAMKFDFQFLGTIYSFWRKVIASRARKPINPRKTKLRLDPALFTNSEQPKRSSRRRDEVITYDEDVIQTCVLRTSQHVDVKQEVMELKQEPMEEVEEVESN